MEENWRKALTVLGAAPSFDLACIGTSIHGLGAFTFEGLACLACADVVYYYPPSTTHYEIMKLINNNLINLHDTLYVRGTAFEAAYDSIVNDVIGTLKSGRKIAYAVQGSPAFHCGTAVRLHRLAKQHGFSSILVSGVSSFELLSAELSEHYDITSIQIYSVSRVVEATVAIDTRAPCLLFDLGRYALPAVRETASTFLGAKISVLAERLRATYPPSHEILLMHVTKNGSCCSIRTNPTDIEKALTHLNAGLTMFLPALRTP